jgi:hypothetical protein
MSVGRDVRLYRIGCGAALIAGPALFFLDNLIHPEELGRGNEAEQLAVIAADPDRWQIAHLIGFVSVLILAARCSGSPTWCAATAPGWGSPPGWRASQA